MKQELWRRAENLFHAALDRAPDVRPSFLDEACGEDTELRRHVERLLAHDERAGTFLEQPVVADLPGPSAGRDTLVGRQHGPYRILSLLGAGGMGEVYQAHDVTLGRDVALKTLPPEFALDPARLARFRREARALAALNHPNIETIHGLEESADLHFLVLELVEGETPRGPLPLAEVLDLASQVADALQAAHEHGIVHRDLKPANLKVTPQGRLKVLDFGLAKAMAGPADVMPAPVQAQAAAREGTVLGHVVGTPGYMSPEQARGAQVDQRTDIWAFGCLLYELLTGKRAFDIVAGADSEAAAPRARLAGTSCRHARRDPRAVAAVPPGGSIAPAPNDGRGPRCDRGGASLIGRHPRRAAADRASAGSRPEVADGSLERRRGACRRRGRRRHRFLAAFPRTGPLRPDHAGPDRAERRHRIQPCRRKRRQRSGVRGDERKPDPALLARPARARRLGTRGDSG